ncbi:hypothetical protein VIBNISFn118_1950003 [Vibrio nigripulchritudo SFn118]|nr:hypothetical protein VIBNISFn118_1950003 [Vibrio nigripulchritudo SFn118]
MLIENGLCFFYQNDHLGTPIRLVDTSGNVVWQASYNPLGQTRIDIEEIRNPLRFQGQYFDEESGLHYNLARYYDPYSGRFIQPDPIGLLGGINHYQYAPNPVMWIDPSGLCCEQPDTAVKAGDTDSQPEKRVVYAMGSGNFTSAAKVNAPTYQLHAVNPNASTDAAFEAIHIALDGLGLIPAFGIFADLSNAGLYAIRGDAFNAGLSLTSAIPIAGQAATAAKYTNKAMDIADATSDTKGIVSTAKAADESLNVTPEFNKLSEVTEIVPNKKLWTEKSIFNTFTEKTIIKTSGLSEQATFLSKHVPELSEAQAAMILDKSFSRNTSVVIGGSRVRGDFNSGDFVTGSDLDVGFGNLNANQAGKLIKNLNKQFSKQDNFLKLEETRITPGNSTPSIETIKSPEEFFQRSGMRVSPDPKAGQPYIPSGSITLSPDGTITILPPGVSL